MPPTVIHISGVVLLRYITSNLHVQNCDVQAHWVAREQESFDPSQFDLLRNPLPDDLGFRLPEMAQLLAVDLPTAYGQGYTLMSQIHYFLHRNHARTISIWTPTPHIAQSWAVLLGTFFLDTEDIGKL